MTRTIVVANGIQYTVSSDDAVARGRRFGALVQARVIDELSQEPLERGVVVEPAGAGLATPAARRGARSRTRSRPGAHLTAPTPLLYRWRRPLSQKGTVLPCTTTAQLP